MDPELKKALEELRTMCGKYPELDKRIAAIETGISAGTETAKTVRAELDSLKTQMTERENTIKELQQKQRVAMFQGDVVHSKRRAIELFGMQCRAALARYLGTEVPAQFRGEAEQVKQYREARATIELQAGSATVLVPTVLEAGMMIDTLEEIQQSWMQADVLTGMPTHATIPTLTGRPTMQAQRASSDTAMTQSDATFSELEYTTKESYVFFPADNWLLELSPVAIGSMLLPLMRDSIMNAMNNWFWNADGTATYNSFTGVLRDATAANIYTLPAGKVNFQDVTAKDLWAAKHKALARGRARGSYFMSDDLLGRLMEESREGKVPFVTFTPDGTTRVWGKPVVVDEMLPDLDSSAISTAFAAFGDLKTMLVVIAGSGITLDTSKEYLFGRNQTAFRGRVHSAIVRKPVKTLIQIKTPAA